MIERTRFDDVTMLRCRWYRSRLVDYAVNAFVVRGVLVDCGFPGIEPELRSLLREIAPRGAFLTHQHEDHAGNVELLASSGIPIGADPRTLNAARHPQALAFYRRFTWGNPRPLASAIRPFHDEQLQLVPTPGHSDDHHVVWDSATDTLFAGDLWLGVKVRVAHPYERPRILVQSLRSMADRNPARMFCGHRGLIEHGAQRLRAKADWLENIIEAVEARINAGDDDQTICRAVLGAHSFTHLFSRGDYSPINIVRAIRNAGNATEAPSAPHAHR